MSVTTLKNEYVGSGGWWFNALPRTPLDRTERLFRLKKLKLVLATSRGGKMGRVAESCSALLLIHQLLCTSCSKYTDHRSTVCQS